MSLKTSRAVRVGTSTYKRGADLSGASPSQVKHLQARGLTSDGPDDGHPDLTKMTVEQLKAHAADRGVDLGDASKKSDIIAAIELAGE